MLVDTHCHLHFDAFDKDREAVIERARAAGIGYLVNVGTDPATNEAASLLAKQYPFMRSTAGLHPHHAHEVKDGDFLKLEEFIKNSKPAAIGEIGLDYFKSEALPQVQKSVFSKMLHLAMDNNLPVIVHSRNAFQDTLEILKSETGGKIRGVMHCFSYDKAALRTLLDFGFFASFTCNLTFKNASGLLEAACYAPLNRVMLETDSPYLAPQTLRGERNEPAHLTHLSRFFAEKRGVEILDLEKATTENAVLFFALK